MHDGVGMAGNALHSLLRLLGSATSFELKRRCYHCDHKRPVGPRQFGELRGRGATCSSTETRAKKNNIGTLDRLAKFAHGFTGGLKRPFGIAPGSEAVGCHRAKRRFSGCHRSVQRLLVRVQRHRFKGHGSSDSDAVRDVHTGIADAEESENRFLTGATIKPTGIGNHRKFTFCR